VSPTEYREWLRVKAVSSDAAFAEYVSDLAFPFHLREAERFVNQHGSALVLEPRGHAKTTLFIHRVARLVGATEGRVRIIVLTSVQEDARYSRTRDSRRSRSTPTRTRSPAPGPSLPAMRQARCSTCAGRPGSRRTRARPSRFRTGAFDDRVDAMVYAADLNPTTAEFSFTSVRL
jgi:hypothetical protein